MSDRPSVRDDTVFEGPMMNRWFQKFAKVAVSICLCLFLASCQTSPAVPYVPPPEAAPEKTGIPIGSIVADLRGDLLEREIRRGTLLRVAVIRYTTPSGSSRTFGRYLAQKIGEGLSGTSGLVLIDPGQVYEALHRLGIEQGLLDTRALLEVGHQVGADILIIGTYTDLGQVIDVQSRLVALPDGRQLGLFSRKIQRTSDVLNLIKVGP